MLGVWLVNQASGNRLVNNDITAPWQGVVLGMGAADNDVIANRIGGVESAGVSLEWETSGKPRPWQPGGLCGRRSGVRDHPGGARSLGG